MPLSLGQRLVCERLRLNWSQEEMARVLGTTARSIHRWEHDKAIPHPHYREQLCHIFHVSSETLFGTISNGESTPSSAFWTIPSRRTPFFVGRDEILSHLHDAFHANIVAEFAQVQVLSGLGGIGKTQIAIEYAYRYRNDYSAVLWLQAETSELLFADVVGLASVLKVPESNEQNQQRVVEGVKRWLERQEQWLLILDNVEDMSLVQDFLPSHRSGYVLVTTRVQATGMMARCMSIEPLHVEEGALFLLRRAKLLAPDASLRQASEAQVSTAKEISQMMNGLPLGLDQAGAYIEETGCSLSEYQQDYTLRQAALLTRRGSFSHAHEASVNTTFSLCFQRVAQMHPLAADILQACAFLAPDSISETIITQAAAELGPTVQELVANPFALNDALAILRMHSLVSRNTRTKTLTIHRLVQVVLKGMMSEQEQRTWQKRVLRALARVFPQGEEAQQWAYSEHLLPHVQMLFEQTNDWNLTVQEAGHLFENAGRYLLERGVYTQAEHFLKRAQTIFLETVGGGHIDIYRCQQQLALLYSHQGRYVEAEPLLQQVLIFREQTLGKTHSDTSETLNDLAVLSLHLGRYKEAEHLFQRALSIWEQKEMDGPEIATILNNLGLLFLNQGRSTEAETILQRTLRIWEHQRFPHPGNWAHALGNLALVLMKQMRYHEAEPLLRQALLLQEQELGSTHPEIARCLNSLAALYRQQARYEEAEPLYQRALRICERHFGLMHIQTAPILNGLALLYQCQGRYQEAEPLFQQALFIREQQLGKDHPDVEKCLVGLATLYRQQGRYREAEPLLHQAVMIRERCFGIEHPDTKTLTEEYVQILEKVRVLKNETITVGNDNEV